MMLNRSKTRESLFIECRKWHDTTYGNTYYSARMFVDGQHLYTTGPTYGYDYQYEYDISTELVARGYLPAGMAGRGIRWARDAGLHVYTSESQTKRRDLWPTEDNQAELDARRIAAAKLRHTN